MCSCYAMLVESFLLNKNSTIIINAVIFILLLQFQFSTTTPPSSYYILLLLFDFKPVALRALPSVGWGFQSEETPCTTIALD